MSFLYSKFRQQCHSVQDYLTQEGKNTNISCSVPLLYPPRQLPFGKGQGAYITAQICCQGRNTYLETGFKILAKKTKLRARHVSHMAQLLYPARRCQQPLQTADQSSPGRQRCLASVLWDYPHSVFYLLSI